MSSSKRVRFMLGVACVSVIPLALFEACGGDDSTNGDAGKDATASDGSTDTLANDVVVTDGGACPTYTGSSAFCQAAVARCNACNTPVSACQKANFATECDGLTPFLSQAYENALIACQTVCDTDASNACQKANLADASLTNAQKKVATDYCTFCDAGGACVGQIETQLNLVEYSDTLAATIDNNCTPDASAKCGFSSFGSCALGTILGALPADPCKDAAAD